ncbi:MAG: phosphatidate cytidylyltransferase [Phycisphaerae bacterium]|nr:phosphatidate cytidylyltransferase [Phycisphaerae bacterium]
MTVQHLFTVSDAFDDPLVVWSTAVACALLVVAFAAIQVLRRLGVTAPELHRELMVRTISWSWLLAIIGAAILLGRGTTILAVLVLSLLAYRDFARATGVFRVRSLSIVVTLGMIALACASADRWHRLYFALTPLVIVLLAVITIPRDEPRGFVQRVGLAIMGFVLFGTALGYLGLLTDTPRYRALLIFLIAAIQLNDIFAFIVGRTLGGPKLIPNTSSGKTISGSVGAVILTTILVVVLGRFLFADTLMGSWTTLIGLGVASSIAGQLGDLGLSSIKRDIGIKDFAAAIPGHGGVLDRFDSLILVPPVLYHIISFVNGPLGG